MPESMLRRARFFTCGIFVVVGIMMSLLGDQHIGRLNCSAHRVHVGIGSWGRNASFDFMFTGESYWSHWYDYVHENDRDMPTDTFFGGTPTFAGWGFHGHAGPHATRVWFSVPYLFLSLFWSWRLFTNRHLVSMQFQIRHILLLTTIIALALTLIPKINPMLFVAIVMCATVWVSYVTVLRALAWLIVQVRIYCTRKPVKSNVARFVDQRQPPI